jgi:hypothetical protein
MGLRHRAPRRQVTSVTRHGSYGTTWWHHTLECGHTERRKRPAPYGVIGCAECERQTILAVLDGPTSDDLAAIDAGVEVEAARLRATLARSLGVDPDAIDVQIRSTPTGLQITGVVVWLPMGATYSILERLA